MINHIPPREHSADRTNKPASRREAVTSEGFVTLDTVCAIKCKKVQESANARSGSTSSRNAGKDCSYNPFAFPPSMAVK